MVHESTVERVVRNSLAAGRTSPAVERSGLRGSHVCISSIGLSPAAAVVLPVGRNCQLQLNLVAL